MFKSLRAPGSTPLISPRTAALLVSALAIGLAGCQPLPPAAATLTAEPATAGAAGVGDPYYEQLGNGGYDVSHYTIALSVVPEANSIRGTTTIVATATQSLSAFNLDLEGLTIDSVEINAAPAQFSRTDHELTLTPTVPLYHGSTFSVSVTYHGEPWPVANVALSREARQAGWFPSASGAISVWAEPNGASSWFPVNDHPRDKATYVFDITVPKPWVVAATGALRETIDAGAHVRYRWEMAQPMASYLAAVNIDHYELDTVPGPDGVTIRNYLPPLPRVTAGMYRDRISEIPAMLEFFSSVFGPYPFEAYGIVIAPDDVQPCQASFGGAMEAQSLSVFCLKQVTGDILAHELAHQWFGNDVSLENWQDLWLKEGLASYAAWLWASREGDASTLDDLVSRERARYSPLTLAGRPPADDLYQWEAYVGGALTFHALRRQVGDDMFFAILRTYRERYHFGHAGTDEFIALAEEISGQELSALFDAWLYTTDLPDLP